MQVGSGHNDQNISDIVGTAESKGGAQFYVSSHEAEMINNTNI
jgi:hypothetical protein